MKIACYKISNAGLLESHPHDIAIESSEEIIIKINRDCFFVDMIIIVS